MHFQKVMTQGSLVPPKRKGGSGEYSTSSHLSFWSVEGGSGDETKLKAVQLLLA